MCVLSPHTTNTTMYMCLYIKTHRDLNFDSIINNLDYCRVVMQANQHIYNTHNNAMCIYTYAYVELYIVVLLPELLNFYTK